MQYNIIVQSNPKSFSPGATQIAAGVFLNDVGEGRHQAAPISVAAAAAWRLRRGAGRLMRFMSHSRAVGTWMRTRLPTLVKGNPSG
jgi:hypothetical protein